MPLLGFGSNSHGQLGIGNTADIDVPTVCVPPLAEPPLCIAGGANHTLIVTAEGKVLTAGHNERGQLGISGHDCHEFTPIIIDIGPTVHISSVACGWDHSVALTTDGCVYVWGSNEYGQLGTGPDIKWSDKPRMLPTLTNVVKIACGKISPCSPKIVSSAPSFELYRDEVYRSVDHGWEGVGMGCKQIWRARSDLFK